MTPEPGAFLSGLRILELGDGVAGSAAAAALASLGAQVTKVADPQSLHRRGRPRAGGTDDAASALLAAVLDRGKSVVGLGEVPGPSHDVVIVDRVCRVAAGAGPARLEDYLAWVEEANTGAWITISAFGLDGPDRDLLASELVVGAAAGSYVNQADGGVATDRPLKLAGWQSLRNAGQAAALAALHGLDLVRQRDGTPVHLDVSAQEAGIAVGPVLHVAHELMGCTGITPGGRRYGAPAGWYPCSDGSLRISAMENHQWEGLVRAMGSPEWAERFPTIKERIENGDEVDDRVSAWTSQYPRLEVETRLQAQGVPATGVYSPADILASPQLAYRGSLMETELEPGLEAKVMTRPFQVLPAAAGGNGDGRRNGPPGLSGLRVLEVGHVLAMPLACAVLGALGADVTKFEDLDRLDMYRRRAPWIGDEPGIDRAAYFAMMNHSKSSVAVRWDQEPEVLASAVKSADVVMENIGGRRAVRMGVDVNSMGLDHPDTFALSSSGFGQTGPLSTYRAYAYNLQSCCGLGYLTRDEDGVPAKIDIAWADLLSGYTIATIVAAWAVGPAGGSGAAIDFAMADCITGRFDEYLAAASRSDDYEENLDRANDQFPLAPNGMYRTADRWLALSVETDRQWAALVEVLASPAALADPAYSSVEGRFEHRRALDDAIGELVAAASGLDLADRLQAAGIPATTVRTPADLVADPHLGARGFFTPVQHPVWGRRRLVGIPWREAGSGPIALRHPPLLDAVDPVQVDTVSGRSSGRTRQ